MEEQEKLLGFDIREMWLDKSDWPQLRQNLPLIKGNIEKPLSVDTMVWQSVFDINPFPTLPDFRGPVQFLWDDITQMRQYFSHISSISQPSWTIAIKVFFNLLTIDERNAWGKRDLGSISPTNYSAKFLGYDVADNFLQSGLTNTIYDESHLATMEQKWGEHLNNYHLFTDYTIANEFRQFINPLAPDHAPFFVYGLYLLDE